MMMLPNAPEWDPGAPENLLRSKAFTSLIIKVCGYINFSIFGGDLNAP